MIEEIIRNVEKEMATKLSQDELVRAKELINRGLDSKAVAQVLSACWR